MKKCSTPYDFRESQITLAVKYMRYHCIPIGMAKIQNTDTFKYSQVCKMWRKRNSCSLLVGLQNTATLKDSLVACFPFTKKNFLQVSFTKKKTSNDHWRQPSKSNLKLQFSHSVVSDSLRPHELQHTRPPCPLPTPRVHPNSCPSSRWCHSAISSSVVPFSSCPQSLPASESSPMSQLFAWGGQSIGVSAFASVLRKNT